MNDKPPVEHSFKWMPSFELDDEGTKKIPDGKARPRKDLEIGLLVTIPFFITLIFMVTSLYIYYTLQDNISMLAQRLVCVEELQAAKQPNLEPDGIAIPGNAP